MITIIGANGFIGSNLLRSLRLRGVDVVGLGRGEFDLLEPQSYSNIPERTTILIHAAGVVGETGNEELLWRTNVHAPYWLAQYIADNRTDCVHVIFLSSGAVYGGDSAVKVESSELHPEGLYATTKLLAEKIFEVHFKHVALVRLFFPYGPGQISTRLIPRLIEKIKRGEVITLQGGGDGAVISPTYIDDVTAQLLYIIEKKITGVINISGAELISIRHLVEKISSQYHVTPLFAIAGKRENKCYAGQSSLPSHLTKWTIDNGIRSVIEAMRES